MHPKSLHTLEFNKVLARLATHTTFSAGRELAEQLTPSAEPAEIARRLRETREALHLLAVRASISLGGAHDVRPQVANARIGATIPPPELLDVRDTLARGRAVRRGLLRLAHDVPRLAEIAAALMDDSRAHDEIARCINDRAEVVDAASPELARLRRELNSARSRLIERLQRMLGSGDVAKYLQEPIITQRGGRYVIPLKSDFKGRVQGIVHDQSASGATVFVEPLATVEMNNHLREIELAEQKEVERVLAALTAEIAAEGDRIVWTVEALAELDLIFARAYYAEALHAKEPLIAQVPEAGRRDAPARVIHLINARHPLLNAQTVVPISLRLDEDVRILVITGPNTGGKTVTLKTVGLFALMAQAGLFLPADDGTSLPVFSDVFADIGDEQSIEQSLSTFSSHMRNVIEFLQAAHRGSLVLMDELGAGTDPVEGSALAQAILEDLRARGIMALVATHYTELKLYAHGTSGVQNASVEFDLETLMPTYRLTVGLPGRSNALAIASRLGLDSRIVEAARERVSGEHLEADSLLSDLKTARQQAEANDVATLKARSEAERLERELRERMRKIEDERRQVLNEAKHTAAQEIEQVRAELAETRKRLQDAAAEPQFRAERARLDALTARTEPLEPAARPGPVRGRAPLAVGDRVWIPTLNQRGEIVALNGADAEVQVGNLRMKMRAVQLEKAAAPAESKPAVERNAVRVSAPSDVPSELHLRGLTADEAVLKLDEYLDDAYMAGLPKVRVVHGKGTGALRKAVRETLEGHPLVAGFRGGDRYEGEDGVTVVELVGR